MWGLAEGEGKVEGDGRGEEGTWETKEGKGLEVHGIVGREERWERGRRNRRPKKDGRKEKWGKKRKRKGKLKKK